MIYPCDTFKPVVSSHRLTGCTLSLASNGPRFTLRVEGPTPTNTRTQSDSSLPAYSNIIQNTERMPPAHPAQQSAQSWEGAGHGCMACTPRRHTSTLDLHSSLLPKNAHSFVNVQKVVDVFIGS